MPEQDEAAEALDAAAQQTITPVVDVHKDPDMNLTAIAQMADFVGFPLTFYMPWGIATGHSASPNAYYKHLGDMVVSGTPPEDTPDWWGDMIERFAQDNYYKHSEIDPTERVQSYFVDGFNLLSFIILKDARCWANGFSTALEHPFLRVRLADINAWAWGVTN